MAHGRPIGSENLVVPFFAQNGDHEWRGSLLDQPVDGSYQGGASDIRGPELDMGSARQAGNGSNSPRFSTAYRCRNFHGRSEPIFSRRPGARLGQRWPASSMSHSWQSALRSFGIGYTSAHTRESHAMEPSGPAGQGGSGACLVLRLCRGCRASRCRSKRSPGIECSAPALALPSIRDAGGADRGRCPASPALRRLRDPKAQDRACVATGIAAALAAPAGPTSVRVADLEHVPPLR